MSRRRWTIWLGPPIALIAIALVLSRFQAEVEAGRPRDRAAGRSLRHVADREERAGQAGAYRRARRLVGDVGSARRERRARRAAPRAGPRRGGEPHARARARRPGERAHRRHRRRHRGRRPALAGPPRLGGGGLLRSWFTRRRSSRAVRSSIPGTGRCSLTSLIAKARADLGTWRYTAGRSGRASAGRAAARAGPERGPIWVTDLRLDPDGRPSPSSRAPTWAA